MRVEFNNSPSYKALWYNQKFTKVQRAVINDIKDQLNIVDKSFSNKTPMQWLFDKGQELFVSKGSSNKSVKLELVDKVDNPNRIRSVFGGYIGEYSKEKKFNPRDIKDNHKDLVAATILAAIASTMIIAGFIGNVINKRPPNAKQNIEQVTKVVADSIKTAPKDTISFVK